MNIKFYTTVRTNGKKETIELNPETAANINNDRIIVFFKTSTDNYVTVPGYEADMVYNEWLQQFI